MGFRASWIGVHGGRTKDLLDSLGLRIAGEAQDFMDTGLWLARLDEWVVICAQGGANYRKLEVLQARQFSEDGQALWFVCNDTTMGCELLCFEDGDESWGLRYDGVDGPSEVVVEGDVPDEASEAIEQTRFQQDASCDEVDYVYETAHRVGEALVGFRIDRLGNEGGYVPLRATPKPTRPPAEAVWAAAGADDGVLTMQVRADDECDFVLRLSTEEDLELARVLVVDFAEGAPSSLRELVSGELLPAQQARDFSCVTSGDAVKIVVDYLLADIRCSLSMSLSTVVKGS